MIRFQERGGLKQAIAVLIERLEAESDGVVRDTVAQILRHLRANRAAAEAWRQLSGVEPELWVKVAARIGALQNADPPQREMLAALTQQLTATKRVLRTLIDTSADVLDDGLVSACLREIRMGATDLDEPTQVRLTDDWPTRRASIASTSTGARRPNDRGDHPVSAAEDACDPLHPCGTTPCRFWNAHMKAPAGTKPSRGPRSCST